MNEHDLIEDMCRDFKAQHVGSFWRKIHGSKFQAGFPDVVAALPDVATLCEFKWCKDDNLLMRPFAQMAVDLLTGLQFAELTMLGALSDTCPLRARVLIGCPVEDEETGRAYELAFGFDVADIPRYRTFSACSVASVCLTSRVDGAWNWPATEFPSGSPPGLEFQLRPTPSKERWRVGALVLGLKRYKVFDVRTKHDPDAHDAMYQDERE